ncbi:MAG: hypothetical protein ACI8Z5_001521 [Lentimonas sp.]|jgi:hypothetical protein
MIEFTGGRAVATDTHIPFQGTCQSLDSFGGTARLSVTVEPVSSLERKLILTMRMTPEPEEVEHLDDTYSDITLTEVGAITSKASLVIPTEFGKWATRAGLSLATGGEQNSQGTPYGLLHVFKLCAEAGVVPVEIARNEAGRSVVSVELPSVGLGRGLKAEYRAILTEGEWLDLPSIHVLSGEGSLDAGESGLVQLTFSSGDQGYIRLSLVDSPDVLLLILIVFHGFRRL